MLFWFGAEGGGGEAGDRSYMRTLGEAVWHENLYRRDKSEKSKAAGLSRARTRPTFIEFTPTQDPSREGSVLEV